MFALDGGAGRRRLVDAARAARGAEGDRAPAVRRTAGSSRRHAGLRHVEAARRGGGARRRAGVGHARPLAAGIPGVRCGRSAREIIGSAAEGMGLGAPGRAARSRRRRGGERVAARGWRRRRARSSRSAPTRPLRYPPRCAARQVEAIRETVMTSPRPLRPQPRPEILAIDAYVPGKSWAPPAPPRSTSCRRTSRRSAPRRRRSRPSAPARPTSRSIPTARRRPCARRSAGAMGSSRADHLRQRLGRAAGAAGACLSRPGRRRTLQRVRLPRISDLHPRGGRHAGRRAGDGHDREMSMRCSRRVTRAPRSSISPTRTIRPAPICRFPRSSGCRPACRRTSLLVLDAAYAEYVTPQRLCGGHRACRDLRKCRDDPHVLEDLRARQSAHRLGLWAGRMCSTRSTASAGRSTSTGRRSRRASPAFADTAHVEAAIAHNARWLPWLGRGDRGARRRGDAERRQFPAAAFPRTPAGRRRRTPS